MMPTGDWATGTLVGGVYFFLHSYTFFNLLNMNKCCLPPQSTFAFIFLKCVAFFSWSVSYGFLLLPSDMGV